jgi:hypothetical protein
MEISPVRPANYAEWRKEQLVEPPDRNGLVMSYGRRLTAGDMEKIMELAAEPIGISHDQYLALRVPETLTELQQIRVKQRVYMHIAQGPAREREALKRA